METMLARRKNKSDVNLDALVDNLEDDEDETPVAVAV